jgi:hypothetical protein
MKKLPQSDETLLVRTDFSNDTVWKSICAAVRVPDPDMQEALGMFAEVNEKMGQPLGDFELPMRMVDDPEYKDVSPDKLVELSAGAPQSILLAVDSITISQPDHPVLIIDLAVEPGRTFRAVPSQIFAIESNLSIANMDWQDFAESVDDDGVFRGFPK